MIVDNPIPNKKKVISLSEVKDQRYFGGVNLILLYYQLIYFDYNILIILGMY